MSVWCIVTVAAIQTLGCTSHACKSNCVAFMSANVVPMHQEVVLDNHTVLVHAGRIAEIGPASRVRIPPGIRRVDGSGKFLMPGLADMHVHILSEDALPLFVANGVTTVRNMYGSPMHLRLRDEVDQGVLLGPRIVTAGPIIDGDPPVWGGSAVATTAEAGAQVAREQAAAGYDFLKVYERLPLAAYDAICDKATELDIPVAGHVPDAVGLKHAISCGQKSIEHLSGYGSALESSAAPPWEGPELYKEIAHGWIHHEPEALQALVRMTVQRSVWNCPTQVVFDRSFPADDTEVLQYAGVQYIGPRLAAMWAKMNQPRPALAALVQKSIPMRIRMISELHRGGARILLGTDCSNLGVVPGFSIHAELENLVKAGLTPFEAILCGTTNAAEFLGESDHWGTIEIGRIADLVLLDGNPLSSVGSSKRISGVAVRGRWAPMSDLTEQLEELASPGEENR